MITDRLCILSFLGLVAFLAICAGCASMPAPQGPAPTTAPATTAAASTPVITAAPTAGYAVYVSPAYGYSLSYPTAWAVREENGGATVVFTTPQEGPSDTFRENLKVVVQDLSSSPMNLDTFVTRQLESKKQAIAGYNLIYDGNPKINGNNARKISYTGTLGSGLMEWVEIYTIKGLTAYTLTFTAEESHYRNWVVDSDRMLNSFAFTS